MEDEIFLSGYCRRLDASRSVYAELADGHLDAVDCDYPDCPYRSNCPIAAELEKLH